jgi:lysophospholipase L1-like esterase
VIARRALLGRAALVVGVAAAAIALSLVLTPMQEVSSAGQTVKVGVAAPSLSFSGPGQLDLFGQQIPTTLEFFGPVRPRLSLSRITLGEQLAQLTTQDPDVTAHSLENALVRGWTHFFIWQIVVVALIAVALLGAAAGWLRYGRRSTLVLIGVGLVVAEVINLGAIMTTAYTAPAKLRSVRSLQDLVGGAPPPTASPPGARDPGAINHVVVLGDSTAAGQGNRPLPDATADDKACHRSIDSFAAALARADDWDVTNLACGGATVRDGVLGPQEVGGRVQPPQIESAALAKADVVILSVGANDARWSDVLALCALSQTCYNNAAEAYFQQQLAGFSRDLLELLTQLQVLPNHPVVVVNEYYDPFAGSTACLADRGLTPQKKKTLEADLAALNEILRNGAAAAGFLSARPDFTDHGICSPQSYVQGLSAKAPFHPTASGQLAIALADAHALHGGPS